MTKQYKLLLENTPSKQTSVSSLQFLLLVRFLSGIKHSPELRVGTEEAAGWHVRLKKYIIASHYTSWGKTLWVSQQGLDKHSGKYTRKHWASSAVGFFLTTLYRTSKMVTIDSAEYFWFPPACTSVTLQSGWHGWVHTPQVMGIIERSLYFAAEELDRSLDHLRGPLMSLATAPLSPCLRAWDKLQRAEAVPEPPVCQLLLRDASYFLWLPMGWQVA